MKKTIQDLFARERFLRVTLPIMLVIALALIAVFSFREPMGKKMGPEEARYRAESFVNTYLMQSGSRASVKDVKEEYGLYKLQIDIGTDVVESYLSKDGRFFFPQALNVQEIAASGAITPSGNTAAAPLSEVTIKTEKPKVELFVMSYCPYGTQMQKGILPVVETLGDKIDFEMKYVDYAMHGEKELVENLNQYCIQKDQPERFQAYMQCFLVAGDSASCLSTTGVSQSKLSSCYAATDQQYKIMENFRNQVGYQGSFPSFDVHRSDNDKYGVSGSPTLIINGQDISSARDSATLLRTICTAFTDRPAECDTVLPSTSPAPGFGTGTVASSAGAAQCQ